MQSKHNRADIMTEDYINYLRHYVLRVSEPKKKNFFLASAYQRNT